MSTPISSALETQERWLKREIDRRDTTITSLKEALKDFKEMAEFYDQYMPRFEPEGCCNGRDCGCLGKPTNPEYYLNDFARTKLEKHKELLKRLEEG